MADDNDETNINDTRSAADFRGISFSKFQKVQVKKELISSFNATKIEAACNWTAELVCAGHFADLWDTIIFMYCKYIHLGNPKLPIYLAMRFANFKDIMVNGAYVGNELAMRNNAKIRQLFAEVVCVLCYSRKKHTLEAVRIKKVDEFDMTHMATRLKAPNVTYATGLYLPDDPKELFIAINEFAYHLSPESHNVVNASYWLEWVLEYEVMCKQKKMKCIAQTRPHMPVLDKFKKDIIWMMWDCLLAAGRTIAAKKHKPVINKILEALLDIFCIKYTDGVKIRRRFVLYVAISLITEPVDYTIEMINPTNKVEIDFIVKKINVVYKGVKKNEQAPMTDYLNVGIKPEKSNRDKTTERLQMMAKYDALNGGSESWGASFKSFYYII